MAEVTSGFHTRKGATLVLKSGDGSPKSYTLKLHPGEALTIKGPETAPVVARDQTGAAYSARPGPVTADAMVTTGKVRIWDLGKNTTEAVSGDIVAVTGTSGGQPVAGYIDSDWAVVSGNGASAGYQTFTVEITIADFGSQKGGVWSGVGYIANVPTVSVEDEGVFYDGLELHFLAGLTYTRNA